jgi:hypothetical protein
MLMAKPLDTTLRNLLQKVVIEARDAAEAGARAALESLAVHSPEPYASLTSGQRQLRNALRAHARQLGDEQDSKKAITIRALVNETAYEHWHRMLFARFLAENNLLMYPDPKHPVPVSLHECEELAKEEGYRDAWEAAATYASKMLPQIFRVDSPVLKLQFAPEHLHKLERLVESLPSEVFTASDSIGWVYQFWQTKRKEEVNASGVKIGAAELPAVTQLFTEDYMVDFLLDNTLGAWWAGKFLTAHAELARKASDETELRKAVSLPNCAWSYLRFIKDHDGIWLPAAGTFEGWPKAAGDITCLDPCMGSGHFVVGMFERMVALRIADEGLDELTAVQSVIRDNLFGLEIDPRCTELAAFALALAAWKRVGFRILPQMNLACSGNAPNSTLGAWLSLAEDLAATGGMPTDSDMFDKKDSLLSDRARAGLKRIYELFQQAPVLGSLIEPQRDSLNLFHSDAIALQPLLTRLLDAEKSNNELHERAVHVEGLASAAQLLSSTYSLVATNVPYLGLNKHNEQLRSHCAAVFPNAKSDLATCFVERCFAFCENGGSTALVTPQSWLFLGTYKKFREVLLAESTFNVVAKLGPGAFETISGEVVNASLIGLSRERHCEVSHFVGIDVSDEKSIAIKAEKLRIASVVLPKQRAQIRNTDSRIVLSEASTGSLMMGLANSYEGIGSGDLVRFSRFFTEIPKWGHDWRAFRGTTKRTGSFAGNESIIYWQDGKSDIYELADLLRDRLKNTWQRGCQAWGKRGLAVNRMGDLFAEFYEGEIFDSNIAAIIPKDKEQLLAMWLFVSSDQFRKEVRRIDQSMKITNVTFLKVPFDLTHWQKVAAAKYPNGLPKPFSPDPTQWLFSGHPKGSDQPLQVAVARLLGYQWPRQTGSSFSDCPELGKDGLEDHSDDDGIVCISSIRGEEPAAERLRRLISSAYGEEWSATKEPELLKTTGSTATNLDSWLRESFFEQHCAIFHNRPFIWHIWDGRKRDGFHALVNYHRLAEGNGKGKRLLGSLTYTYLGDWILRQQDGVQRGEDGADGRLAAALELKKRLEEILKGEPPFDIFVRWKPLHQQAIGWEPDINDGVRMNIRPFLTSDIPGGKKGAGILRSKPNIKWDKDRGKEPKRSKEEYPWFWEGSTFSGNRVNDIHLTIDEKTRARDKQQNTKK